MKRICRLDAGGGPACYETERGHMEETKLAERKAMLTALFRDPAYIPMKAKEIAALLNIPKGQREEPVSYTHLKRQEDKDVQNFKGRTAG